jgi:membrane associated rhomboid family serine protease
MSGYEAAMRDGNGTDGAEALALARDRLRAGAPVILRPRLVRRMLLLVLCLVLAVGSVVLLVTAPNAIAALGTLLFGTGMLYAALQSLPGRAYLRIAPDGLTVRTPLKTTRWDWNDVEHFTAYEISHQYTTTKHVGFDRRDLTPQRQGVWRTIGRGMTGVDETLPDTYGLPHDGLAELLDEARDRYATEHGVSASERADRVLAAQAAQVRRDRVPVVTGLLAIACVALFASEVQRYGAFPDVQELLDAGGASRDALADGRWWTLLSANVLHANPIHLLLNLVALVIIGTLLERELGWARFAGLCLAGAVAAMGLAVLLHPAGVVVGISGVIFAVAGRAVMRDPYRTRALGAVAWSLVPVGVIYTLLTPGVSIGAHIGGLLAGLALGYAFERRTARRQPAPSV